MLQFINTEYFNYAWGILFGALLLWLFVRWRTQKLKNIATLSMLKIIMPGFGNRFYLFSGILILSTIAFIIFAMANPVLASKPVKGQKKGLDIAIALDVSRSMDAQDLKPSRLTRAVQFISNLNNKLGGNRIGLVVFAGNAYVQMPLTSDAPALKLFMDNISTNIISEQGTAIGDAITTSKDVLFPGGKTTSATNTSKIIILLTDGENHDDDALEAAKQARNKGIVIYPIGVGSEAGSPIPLYSQDVLQGYLKDDKDQTVISKLDPNMLQDIASITHGSYFRLNEQEDIIPDLLKKINSLAKGEQDYEVFDLNETRFQWFAAAALFLLLLEAALRFRGLRKYKMA